MHNAGNIIDKLRIGCRCGVSFFLRFFEVDHFLSLMEFLTILLPFYILIFWPQGS